jgi:hypothetical protein
MIWFQLFLDVIFCLTSFGLMLDALFRDEHFFLYASVFLFWGRELGRTLLEAKAAIEDKDGRN